MFCLIALATVAQAEPIYNNTYLDPTSFSYGVIGWYTPEVPYAYTYGWTGTFWGTTFAPSGSTKIRMDKFVVYNGGADVGYSNPYASTGWSDFADGSHVAVLWQRTGQKPTVVQNGMWSFWASFDQSLGDDPDVAIHAQWVNPDGKDDSRYLRNEPVETPELPSWALLCIVGVAVCVGWRKSILGTGSVKR